jgi:glyoxylase-like metal-dependent hydrolase (beta-lactamase superfamily II)
MRLTAIMGNTQKLDGGAMFGHVPKAVWQQWMQPDEQNRITLACRALLVQIDNKNVLLETGIGAFFEPGLKERYGVVESEHVLLDSLQAHGLSHEDIDVVILSHLHFDHAGGLLSAWQPNKKPALLFPKARYVVSQSAWERARHPHVRDKASFIPGLDALLTDSGRLEIVDGQHSACLSDAFRFTQSNGHTPGLLHTMISVEGQDPIIFASDLIPGASWVHLPVGMGYDRSAELLLEEKRIMLDDAIERSARLFYTHDPVIAASYIKQEKPGKYVAVPSVL